MNSPRDERLIIGYQENLIAAVYTICERYHVPFWKVLEKNLEYEILEMNVSDSSYEMVHPVMRLSMQAVLAIPSYIEEEGHENAVSVVEDEVKDHFDFFMEDFKCGDVSALKKFMEEESYLLTEDFEEILSEYLNTAEYNDDYFMVEDGFHELIHEFPHLVIEICKYTLKNLPTVASCRKIPYHIWSDEESYQAMCNTFKDVLQTMVDFKEYQGVPFTLKKEEWQQLLTATMDDLDGHMLNFAVSILENSLGVDHEEIEEFIGNRTMSIVIDVENAKTPRERVSHLEQLIYLLPNDIVYKVVSYENPSLIE